MLLEELRNYTNDPKLKKALDLGLFSQEELREIFRFTFYEWIEKATLKERERRELRNDMATIERGQNPKRRFFRSDEYYKMLNTIKEAKNEQLLWL